LASRRTVVQSDIEAVSTRIECVFKISQGPINPTSQLDFSSPVNSRNRDTVRFGNYETVAGRDRILVPDCYEEFIFRQNAI
jgi:hypothetical protein